MVDQKSPKLGRYEGISQKLLQSYDPKRVYVDIRKLKKSRGERKYSTIDLFSGAGGISCGLESVGFEVSAAVEVSEVAAETHKYNFPKSKVFCGDIKEFNPKDFIGKSRIDLVVGGPPCQGFSVAGKRNPKDPRNRLFREFVRVVDEMRPHYFVMENVPGILTMSNGKVKEAILEAFEEIGYPGTSVAVLEAATYGVPQLRSRAIFIGNRHGLPNPFPAPTHDEEQFLPIESAISDLPAWERIPEMNHEWTKHSEQFMRRIKKVKPGNSLYPSYVDAYKRQYPGLPSMTIKENHGGTHIHPSLDRCISAREMARLQSFPDNFYFTGGMKKAMWQIGNAVPPRLAEVIGLSLRPFLDSIKEKRKPQFDRVILDGEVTSSDLLFDVS